MLLGALGSTIQLEGDPSARVFEVCVCLPGSTIQLGGDPSALLRFESKGPAMKEAKRAHIVYTGNVQGVGFRFAAERIANKQDITGFARNLPGGDVEVVCEGSGAGIDSFLEDIREHMAGYIRDYKMHWEPATGEFSSFGIRF